MIRDWFKNIIAAVLGMTRPQFDVFWRLGLRGYRAYKKKLKERVDALGKPGGHLLDLSTGLTLTGTCIKCGKENVTLQWALTSGGTTLYQCPGLGAAQRIVLYDHMLRNGKGT